MRKLVCLLFLASSFLVPSIAYAQKGKGWKSLFDGKTMNGWKFFKGSKNNTWEIKDGALHCKPKRDGDQRADLITVDEFENFELAFKWKVSQKGNSGVMFRVTEDLEAPYLSGPEFQVKDDIGYPEVPKELKEAGANYDMHAPVNKIIKPVGEWNSSKIVANGKHVEHWLNGKKILEYELGSPDWIKRKENSKWKNAKGYGMTAKGHIDLQDHDQEVWYKDIKIKSL